MQLQISSCFRRVSSKRTGRCLSNRSQGHKDRIDSWRKSINQMVVLIIENSLLNGGNV